MRLTTAQMQPQHIYQWCWERRSRTLSSWRALGTWRSSLRTWKIVSRKSSFTSYWPLGIKLEAIVEEFPKPLEVSTRENWMRDTFDIYYGTPEYSKVPCNCKCKDKANCAHKCCKLVEFNVTLGIILLTHTFANQCRVHSQRWFCKWPYCSIQRRGWEEAKEEDRSSQIIWCTSSKETYRVSEASEDESNEEKGQGRWRCILHWWA